MRAWRSAANFHRSAAAGVWRSSAAEALAAVGSRLLGNLASVLAAEELL